MASTFTSVMSLVSGVVKSNDQFAFLNGAVGDFCQRDFPGIGLADLGLGHELCLFVVTRLFFTFSANAASQRTGGKDGDLENEGWIVSWLDFDLIFLVLKIYTLS